MALFIRLLVLLLVLAALARLIKPAPAALDSIHGRPILSPPELAFYHQLCRAPLGYLVFSQVAANAMLELEKGLPKAKWSTLRNRYSQRHVDFTVCHLQTLEIVGIVEVNGRQHRTTDDA